MSFIRTEDNIRLFTVDLMPAGGVTNTVVFVHGWPLDHTIFDYQVLPLTRLGYRCVGIDLRGFGRSETCGRGSNYNQMSDDLCRIIRQLNLRHFTLVGFSMGAGACARYMRRHQGWCVDRLCLVGGALPQFTEGIQNPAGVPDSGVALLMRRLETDRPKALWEFAQNCFYRPQSAPFMEWLAGMTNRADITSVVGGLEALRTENCRPDLAAISVPTALFHGCEDRICPIGMAELAHQLIPGSRLYTYPESGHCCHIEQQSAFNADFLDFISVY